MEDEVKNDQTLSLDEKSMIFTFTIPIYDNLSNIKDMLARTDPKGRSMCFFCNILNVFVTVVVAAIVVTVGLVGVVAAGAALLSLSVGIGSYGTIGLVGAAMGAIVGVGYAIDDTCIIVSDYGQEIYTGNGFIGLGSGQC